MVIVESYLSQRAFGRHLEMDLLEPLGRAMVVVLLVYGVLRFITIRRNGALQALGKPGYEAWMFLIEVGMGVVLPVGLLLSERVRSSQRGLVAAGAFTLTAIVHLFNIRRFEPIVRPTVLTGFLGYLFVIFALLYDLGQPWRIWHALVFWNPHSVMFEVAWCVMLYTLVLALEFSPIVFERLRLERPRRFLKAMTTPLVIAGVLLSTLHQSSLGSLYLIVPEKLHPLWYTQLLPLLFYISAIGAGIGMTIVESHL